MKDLEEITNLYLIKNLGWRKDLAEDLTRDDHSIIHKTLRFQCFLVRYRLKREGLLYKGGIMETFEEWLDTIKAAMS